MTYSSSNKKRLLGALFSILVILPLSAQYTQIPFTMVEDLLHAELSFVPKNEFHRVFQEFTAKMYPGRSSVFQAELKDFTASFVLYITSTNAFKNYTPPPPPPPKPPAAPPSPPPPPFPATHRLTADITLFADQDAGAAVVAALKKGTAVQVQGYGGYADIDNITAKWAQVKTSGGQTGWLFSGYLEELKK
ncbi:MAG: SH3 domain-containing protein [Treponema sp.]|jgi:hypothetical protein|nr:SH3 domain-containing protein [Treponema sp.]